MAERGGKEEEKARGKGRTTGQWKETTGLEIQRMERSSVYGTTSWGSHDARTLPVTSVPLQLFGFLVQADAF